jgi:hypothetical protein
MYLIEPKRPKILFAYNNIVCIAREMFACKLTKVAALYLP